MQGWFPRELLGICLLPPLLLYLVTLYTLLNL